MILGRIVNIFIKGLFDDISGTIVGVDSLLMPISREPCVTKVCKLGATVEQSLQKATS